MLRVVYHKVGGGKRFVNEPLSFCKVTRKLFLFGNENEKL